MPVLYKGRLATEHYAIENRKLNGFPGMTIAFLTDLHNCLHGVGNEELLQQIYLSSPDFILCAGDMLVGKAECDCSVPLELFRRLAVDYPVYYANGNHEARLRLYPEEYGAMYEEYMDALHAMGVVVLNNRSISLQDRPVRLYGLDMDRFYYKRFRKTPMESGYLHTVLGSPEKDSYNILLAHNPLYDPEYASWGADLVLSGHIHGGLIRLPGLGGVVSPQVRFFPKYSGGMYHLNHTELVVSRGLGIHSIPIRINNSPELSVIHIQGEQ